MKNIILSGLCIFSLLGNVNAQQNKSSINNNLVVGDFDNDGINDDILGIASNNSLPELFVWSSDNVSFTERSMEFNIPFDLISTNNLHGKVVSGDFDHDGFIDDIAAVYEIGVNQTSITVWINNNGTFSPSRWWYGGDFDANQISNSIVVGDFNNDGFVDDIAAFYDYDQTKTKVFVWESTGKNFKWPGTWWIGNDFNSTRIQRSTVVGDFDHDGFKDDIAALYNYSDDFCKIFVWTKSSNKFNWPYTWYAQENSQVKNALGNIVSGDFNNNGFTDNIAAIFTEEDNYSHIYVWERYKNKFGEPTKWWYGNEEGEIIKNRLVSIDFNGDGINNHLTGLTIKNNEAELITWSPDNKNFLLPTTSWQGPTSIDDCIENGGCLDENLQSLFTIYPNPSLGEFSIEIPAMEISQMNISIYNILGSKIDSRTVTSGDIIQYSIPNLKSGNYLVKISCNEFTHQQQLLIE